MKMQLYLEIGRKSAINRLVTNSTKFKIAENFRLLAGLDDLRQRRAAVCRNGFAQGRFLARAGRQHPDFSRRRNRCVSQAHSIRRRFGGISDRAKNRFRKCAFYLMQK